MSEQPPEAPPAEEDVQSPEDVRHDPPENKGSGQFAVWDATLSQYVSGVSDKAGASRALKDLKNTEFNGGQITADHDLEVREV